MRRPPTFQSPTLIAKAALFCGILAPLLVTAARLTGEAEMFVSLQLGGLIVSAIGLVLAVIAWLGQRNGMVTAALWLNAVWLAVYVGALVRS